MDFFETHPVDPFDFEWRVPAHGYEWVQAFVPPVQPWEKVQHEDWQWLLVQKNQGDRMRPPYRPLSDFEFLGLFRVFSEVSLSRESILEFANRYGMLGIPRQGYLSHPWPAAYENGETLYDWAIYIEQIRQAIEVWDMLRKGGPKELGRFFRWGHKRPEGSPKSPPNWWFYRSHPDKEIPNVAPDRVGAFPGEHTDSMWAQPGLCRPGDIMTPAKIFLAKWITQSLKGFASPQMSFDAESQRLSLRIVPASLLAAMWLQLARAIDTNKIYRRCKACPCWFEVAAGNSRTDRLFCSDRCKSRDYRSKKQEAIQLHDKKWTLQKIAKKLSTTPEVVKRWIVEGEEK